MNILCAKKKIKYISFFSLMILFAFYPAYFEEIPIISKYDIIVNLFLASTISLCIVKYHCSSVFFLLTLIYFLFTLYSTILNYGDIATAVWGNGILLITLLWAMYAGFRKDHVLFEKNTYRIMYVLIVLNLVSVFLFPDGMITDSRGITDINFFLGNYNAYIPYVLITLMCGYLYQMDIFKRTNIWWKLIFVIGIVFYMKKFSATSCVGLILIFLYVLLFNKKYTRKFLNLKIYTMINLLFFISFVWKSDYRIFLAPILNLVNKDFTFTGRTIIWERVKKLIFGSPVFGIGLQTGEAISEKIEVIPATHAHNLYLNILLTTGVIGFIIFAVIFCYMAYKISNIRNPQIRYFIEAVTGILMFMAQFEAYGIKFIFFLMMLFCLYAEQDSKSVESKEGVK